MYFVIRNVNSTGGSASFRRGDIVSKHEDNEWDGGRSLGPEVVDPSTGRPRDRFGIIRGPGRVSAYDSDFDGVTRGNRKRFGQFNLAALSISDARDYDRTRDITLTKSEISNITSKRAGEA